jgi:putative endonuclease
VPFIDIARCVDDTLYVGHTDDLASREKTHNDGQGAVYTAARRPVRIVYAEEHASVASAIARERQLKRWSNKKKEALITDNRTALRLLGRRAQKSSITFTWRDLLKAQPVSELVELPATEELAARTDLPVVQRSPRR